MTISNFNCRDISLSRSMFHLTSETKRTLRKKLLFKLKSGKMISWVRIKT